MIYDLVLRHGTVVTADTTFQADVGILGETIGGLGSDLQGAREIDCAGKLILPGAVDIHVHLQYPVGGLVSADDFFTGTRAAALGGTTAIVDFVEAEPDERLVAALTRRRAEAADQAVVDYGFHMTIKPTDMGKLDQVAEAVSAGCATFKLYMAYGFRLHDGELLRAFQALARSGALAVVHAENWDVIQTLVAGNLAAGRTAPHWHPRSRPTAFEAEATARVIEIARFAGIPVHIFHVSCGSTARAIAAARARGWQVTGETCPQYLVLDDSVFERPGVDGALPICSPPIRAKDEAARLWAALRRGDLGLISTDHCPFWRADKEARMADFSQVPGGVPSIQARLALAFTFGVRAGHLSLSQWVDRCCAAPARLAGFPRKGAVAPGFDADLVVFDPERSATLSTETLAENVDWTPYEGLSVDGWPVMTLSRGRVVVEDGAFVGEAGAGAYVSREVGRRASKVE